MAQNTKKVGWKGLNYTLGALAGLITHRLLESAWKGLRDASPPVAADRRSPWPEALGWAVATGVGMGVSRLLAIRTAAGSGRRRFTKRLRSLPSSLRAAPN